MYNNINFKRYLILISIACIPECSLATLYGFNIFLLKIFRAQMHCKKGVMDADGLHRMGRGWRIVAEYSI
jgi:hypothetical protein